MKILEDAKKKCVPEGTVTAHFPKDHNLCKMINRARERSRPKAPAVNGSDLLDFELRVDQLTSGVPDNFYRGDATSIAKNKTRRHFIFWCRA